MRESIQEYAADIERLAQAAYGDCRPEELERHKIEAFVDGLRDVEVKRWALMSPSKSFKETVGSALTAASIGQHQVMVRRTDVEEHSQAASFNGKCYKCGEEGHMARNCGRREPRTRRPTKAEDHRVLGEEDHALN